MAKVKLIFANTGYKRVCHIPTLWFRFKVKVGKYLNGLYV